MIFKIIYNLKSKKKKKQEITIYLIISQKNTLFENLQNVHHVVINAPHTKYRGPSQVFIYWYDSTTTLLFLMSRFEYQV